MLRRYRWLETETWYATLDELPSEQRESTWTGHGFIHQPAISRIHRLRTATQRSFHETLTKLRALQAERSVAAAEPEPDPDPASQPVEDTASFPEIGFVPSISVEAAGPTPDAPRTPSPVVPRAPAPA